MFSDTAYKNADACRFCWMCRHLCPIALKTGKEINSARAKGLMVSMIKRGEEYDPSMAAIMWECCLCGACANDCATGYDPRIYIREARSLALAEGIAPQKIAELADKMIPEGRMFDGAVDGELLKRIEARPEKAEVLLLLGQTALYRAPELARAAMDIMDKAGVSYAVLHAEPDSGAYLGDMIGFVDEVKAKAHSLNAAVAGSGARTVVALDPMDARIMKHEYPEWNCAVDAQVYTATAFFAELLVQGKLVCKKLGGLCSVHDSGAQCRDLNETEPVRDLAAAMGLEIAEMFRHKKLAKSCGGALLMQYAPELSRMVAQGRWEDMLRTGSRLMVTEAPGSYCALGQCIPADCELTDILLLLAKASR